MKTKQLKTLAFAAFCLSSAIALAYTTAPCVNDYPKCDLSKEGAQCGGGTGTISFGDAQSFAYYYCGGNSSNRCGGPNSTETCSELLYNMGTAREVFCGDTSLGWCYTSMQPGATYTGYDCGLNPCPDVPNRIPPNIVGTTLPCSSVLVVHPCPAIPEGDGLPSG